MTGPTAAPCEAPVLDLRSVTQRYGDRVALDAVDLRVEAGTVLALVGPNGAGKSTLVSVAAGLIDPDEGDALVAGRPASGRGGARRRNHRRRADRPAIGLAAQEIGVYPPLTVRQNLCFCGEIAGLDRAEARRRAEVVADQLRLGDLLERRAGQLSGGEQRRLHAAGALVHSPALVLLDEPTAGADIETRAAVLDVVRSLADEGAAVVYTTHYLPEVEQLGAEVAIIERGRIVVRDTVDALVRAHGGSTIVLDFDGPPPPIEDARHPDEHRALIPCADAAPTLARILAGLGPEAPRLDRVEIVPASLDAAYLRLTGRRLPTPDRATPDGSTPDGSTPADDGTTGRSAGERGRVST